MLAGKLSKCQLSDNNIEHLMRGNFKKKEKKGFCFSLRLLVEAAVTKKAAR